MSFGIFFLCFRNGEITTIKRTLVEEIFGRDAIALKFPLTSVDYIDGGAQIYGANKEDDIEHISFDHFGGDTFFSALYELADRSGSLIVWPGNPCFAVTREALIAHLPREIVDENPKVVGNGAELAAYVASS